MAFINKRRTLRRSLLVACCALQALLTCACAAANRPPDTSAPRANEQPYPVMLVAGEERNARALSAWKTLTVESGERVPAPELQPVTATLRELPDELTAPLRLPKVSIKEDAELTEEERRESLRRFIAGAAPLLGVQMREISLIEIVDAAGGAKRARYRQNPFELPLRNGYGTLEIVFTPDLRVTELSSTAIPDAERLGRSLAGVTAQLTAEQAVASLANRTINYTDATGAQQSRALPAAGAIAARELVVFPLVRPAAPATLELHLAWEISVEGTGEQLLVYVDAVTGEQLAGATVRASGAAAR